MRKLNINYYFSGESLNNCAAVASLKWLFFVVYDLLCSFFSFLFLFFFPFLFHLYFVCAGAGAGVGPFPDFIFSHSFISLRLSFSFFLFCCCRCCFFDVMSFNVAWLNFPKCGHAQPCTNDYFIRSICFILFVNDECGDWISCQIFLYLKIFEVKTRTHTQAHRCHFIDKSDKLRVGLLLKQTNKDYQCSDVWCLLITTIFSWEHN